MGLRATFEDASEESFVSRKRMTEEMELDITPLIDVTFLLLIFFMVTSTMQAQKDLRIPQAVNGEPIPTEKATIVMLEHSGSPNVAPKIILPPTEEGEKPWEGSLEDLTRVVQEALDTKNKAHVIVRADGRIPNGHISKVLRAIGEVDGVTFSMGVREKKGN